MGDFWSTVDENQCGYRIVITDTIRYKLIRLWTIDKDGNWQDMMELALKPFLEQRNQLAVFNAFEEAVQQEIVEAVQQKLECYWEVNKGSDNFYVELKENGRISVWGDVGKNPVTDHGGSYTFDDFLKNEPIRNLAEQNMGIDIMNEVLEKIRQLKTI